MAPQPYTRENLKADWRKATGKTREELERKNTYYHAMNFFMLARDTAAQYEKNALDNKRKTPDVNREIYRLSVLKESAQNKVKDWQHKPMTLENVRQMQQEKLALEKEFKKNGSNSLNSTIMATLMSEGYSHAPRKYVKYSAAVSSNVEQSNSSPRGSNKSSEESKSNSAVHSARREKLDQRSSSSESVRSRSSGEQSAQKAVSKSSDSKSHSPRSSKSRSSSYSLDEQPNFDIPETDPAVWEEFNTTPSNSRRNSSESVKGSSQLESSADSQRKSAEEDLSTSEKRRVADWEAGKQKHLNNQPKEGASVSTSSDSESERLKKWNKERPARGSDIFSGWGKALKSITRKLKGSESSSSSEIPSQVQELYNNYEQRYPKETQSEKKEPQTQTRKPTRGLPRESQRLSNAFNPTDPDLNNWTKETEKQQQAEEQADKQNKQPKKHLRKS